MLIFRGGFVKVYFALTCPSNDDQSVFTFTDNIVKGVANWVASGKKPSVNVPLSCVRNNYYVILEEIRKHPIVQELSDVSFVHIDFEVILILNGFRNGQNMKRLINLNIYLKMSESLLILLCVFSFICEFRIFNHFYFQTYWLSTGQKDIRFVDIGCGNGVISYLLNSLYGDSVKGIGYDVKSRKIWDFYKSKGVDVLKVQPILPNFPSLEQPFPEETNYIIGIHTDEMTPWIPLLSMK